MKARGSPASWSVKDPSHEQLTNNRIMKADEAMRQAEVAEAENKKKLDKIRGLSMIEISSKTHQMQHETQAIQDKKHEFLRTQNEHRLRLDTCCDEVRSVKLESAKFEEAVRVIENWQRATSQQIQDLTDQSQKQLNQLASAVDSKIKAEEGKRDRQLNEVQKLLTLNEQKLMKSMNTEVAEEASTRGLLNAEVAALKQSIVQMKSHFGEEIRKMQELVAHSQSKLQNEAVDLKNMIGQESYVRDIELQKAKADIDLNLKELMDRNEAKYVETFRETKAAFSQVTLILDQVRAENAKEAAKSYKRTEEKIEGQEARLNNHAVEMQKFSRETTLRVDSLAKQCDRTASAFAKELDLEKLQRTGDLAELNERMAAEHLRREKDEGSIISMLELLMTQNKNTQIFSP